MSALNPSDTDYRNWLINLSQRYKSSQLKAATFINKEMLKFYWSLGRDIVTMQAENIWGNKFFKKLSYDLKQVLPGIKGLSETNLGYSKRFFILYNKLDIFNPQVEGITNNNLIHPQAEGEIPESILWKIPWGHHKYIIDKFYNHPQKALFFVKNYLILNNYKF